MVFVAISVFRSIVWRISSVRVLPHRVFQHWVLITRIFNSGVDPAWIDPARINQLGLSFVFWITPHWRSLALGATNIRLIVTRFLFIRFSLSQLQDLLRLLYESIQIRHQTPRVHQSLSWLSLSLTIGSTTLICAQQDRINQIKVWISA